MATTLSFTGERMVPHASDIATELFHWQRYLYFRPWYEDANVVDAASGEGYGADYIAPLATLVTGLEIDDHTVRHARRKYAKPAFVVADVCDHDYREADLVVSFETIEHLPDPSAFLTALQACPGRIVVSTPNRNMHSPGNALGDKPLNPYHTVEWTPVEFAALIREHFSHRQVRFLSQQGVWPGTIREGLDEAAHYVIAVVGDGDLPQWPRLGIAVPTLDGAARCRDLVVNATRYYPGEIEFAIVDNGSSPAQAAALEKLRQDFPAHVHVIHLANNVGYGRGANVGLDFLATRDCGYFCVSNDDVAPAVDCLPQLVAAMAHLEADGRKPGVIGPVTNNISGRQQVDIGPYANYAEMLEQSGAWRRDHISEATEVAQLRGLLMLIAPDCLREVGGFDPRFGIGNFEDDDHNLRSRLAGYSLWIADGAFLHHTGSQTFAELKVDYDANIQRNLQLICEKWGMADFNEFLTISRVPGGVPLYVPLDAQLDPSGHSISLHGETIDLVHQASDMEFAAYVFSRLQGRPRTERHAVIEALNRDAA